ncbi:MAG: prolyl oligopeptidase family serine peptidase [Acidobacteriota bacterium]
MRPWRSKWILVAALALSSGLLRAQDAGEALLDVGAVQTGQLGPGETRGYPAVLGKGDYVKVVAQQKGVDLVLTVLDPDGAKCAEVDSPNGAFGPEPWEGELSKAGTYIFQVSSPDPKSKPGAYEIKMLVRLAADEYASHKIVPLEPGVLERFRGNFEVAPGRVLFVGPMAGIFTAGGKDILYFRDSETRRTGPLYPASATRFFSGPDLGDPYPPEDEFAFTMNAEGAPESLVWTPRGGAPVKAKKVDPFRYEPVAFDSGGAILRGYVLVPEGRGPFPAVLHVNGSQGSRADVGTSGNFFVRQGFAFMAFDKRGAGKSTGRWQEASLEDLADDVLKGLEVLKARPDVDAKRLGLWGASQGGWVGAIAASRSPDVSFLVVQSGSGVSVVENMAHESRSQMAGAGLSGADLEEGTALVKRLLQMMADGRTYEEVAAAGASAEGRSFAPFVAFGKLPRDHYLWKWVRLCGNTDSAHALRKVRCPVLWFLGDRDSQVPAAVSEKRIRDALAAGGNPDYTVKVLSPANHGLLECSSGLWSEVRTCKRYVSGYWETMADWLMTRAGETR